MDIKTAKDTIKNTIRAYLKKNEFNQYVIPRERQRPILLIGAPGIGKTAIMEQIAHDLDIGLVAYSITHHTRQSALGLPFIVDKTFGSVDTKITEYTMSEIIAAVYEQIEQTKNPFGLLFIDEINCASETLAPTMLQFLQNKMFGTHRVPQGWIIVGAGNPPEYNKSVKEFDIVTLDRVKTIDIEPDYKVWKEYAYSRQMHTAIISFIDMFPRNFYFAETEVDGLKIVTPRAWEDLSYIIKTYEEMKLNIDKDLVIQYLQNQKVATEFINYYNLFIKYREQYDIKKILNGTYNLSEYESMSRMRVDEKMAVEGMLIENLSNQFVGYCSHRGSIERLFEILKEYKQQVASYNGSIYDFNHSFFKRVLAVQEASLQKSDYEENLEINTTIQNLTVIQDTLLQDNPSTNTEAFQLVKSLFDTQVKAVKNSGNSINKSLSNVFEFIVGVFTESSELIVLITELTVNPYSVKFLKENRNEGYFKYSKNLLIGEKSVEILNDIKALNLSLDSTDITKTN